MRLRNLILPTLAVLSLSACMGSTSDDSDTSIGETNPTPPNEDVKPPPPEPNNPFPEPALGDDRYDPAQNVFGFYDWDIEDNQRPIRNDLYGGSLEGMVQFGQNLTLDPTGDAEKFRPVLVSQREALLMLTPVNGSNLKHIEVEVSIHGELKQKLRLSPPSEMPRSDSYNLNDRPDVVYSTRAWTTKLNWDWMVPGLSLTFSNDQQEVGELPANSIEFGGAGQYAVNNIQLGLLTDYPSTGTPWKVNAYMIDRPEEAAADYFQTIPAAEIIVAQYEPLKLDRVILTTGEILEGMSEGVGGVHGGNMRQDVAKSTFSLGINMANAGYVNSNMNGELNLNFTQQLVVHHAMGRYKYDQGNPNAYPDGVNVLHGLSGGNGMLTLHKSFGNEFSHENGHHYGMGDYHGRHEGGQDRDFWSRGNADNGWGYIAYRNRMRANFHWGKAVEEDWDQDRSFKGLYVYEHAPMNSGNPSSALSQYTMYTAYDTQTRVQPSFNGKAVYDASSPTGYKKWNPGSGTMEIFQPQISDHQLNYFWRGPEKSNDAPKPKEIGVPVFTILGGYIPEENVAVIYPAARTNWGNVFEYQAPKENADSRQCWLDVSYQNMANKKIVATPNILWGEGKVVKLHINIAQSDKPTGVALFCQEPGEDPKQKGNSIAIATDLPPMPAATIIGKEKGYDALWATEKAEFTNILLDLAQQSLPVLNERGLFLYNSWADRYRNDLNAAAKQQLERYETLQSNMQRLNRWMFAWNGELQGNNAEADQALIDLVVKLNLIQEDEPIIPVPTTTMTVGNNSCLVADLDTGKITAYGSAEPECTDESQQAQRTWLVDALGRIHSGADLTQCINSSNPINLGECDLKSNNQMWDFSALPNIKKPGTNSCLDMDGGALWGQGSKTIILYGCGNGQNQKWANVEIAENNVLLPLLHATNLPIIQRIMQKGK